ncbi:MAG: hypothetical protein VXZ83_05500 [Verrucomicrobiota bacterium]|nr:hypothetical protein [Verrucomicrobiota bacterium]
MNDYLINKALHRIDVEMDKLKKTLIHYKPSSLEGSSSKKLRRAYNYRMDKLFAMEDALLNFQEIGNIDENEHIFGSDITTDLRQLKELDTVYYEKTGVDGKYAVKGC